MKSKDKISLKSKKSERIKDRDTRARLETWRRRFASHSTAMILVALFALAGNSFTPLTASDETNGTITLNPWQQALDSYWGYQRLERQIGNEQTLKVVELLETCSHPEMVKAIIEVESAWRVKALSTKDARGLMQIRHIAAREVDPNVLPDELYDPVRNVILGIEIFENHMEYFLGFDDPQHWALTSYNRGRSGTFALKMDPPTTRYSRKVLERTDRM